MNILLGMRRGSAGTTALGVFMILIGAVVVFTHVVRVHEGGRKRAAEQRRKVKAILDDAAVRIRLPSRQEDLQFALSLYDQAYRLSSDRDYVKQIMWDTACFMYRQTSENSALFYNTRDLIGKMMELGFRDSQVVAMHEEIHYFLNRGKYVKNLNLLSASWPTPVIVDGSLITIYQGTKVKFPPRGDVFPEPVDLGPPVISDLLHAGGRIVVASLSGRVTALGEDGATHWQVSVAERFYDSVKLASDGERAFVLASEGTATALALSDGTRLWSLPSGGPKARAILSAPGALVVVLDSEVRALEPGSGKPIWTRPVEGAYVALLGGSMLIASKKMLVAVEARTGRERWTASLPADVSAQILSWGDRVLVPMENARVAAVGTVAVRGAANPILWSTKLESEVAEPHSHDHGHDHDHDDHQEKRAPGTKLVEVCSSPGALARGKAYFMGQETLFCLDAKTGEIDWVYGGFGRPRTNILISGGQVYIGYEQGESRNTFITAVNTGLPSEGWTQFGADAARTFRATR